MGHIIIFLIINKINPFHTQVQFVQIKSAHKQLAQRVFTSLPEFHYLLGVISFRMKSNDSRIAFPPQGYFLKTFICSLILLRATKIQTFHQVPLLPTTTAHLPEECFKQIRLCIYSFTKNARICSISYSKINK